MSAAAALISLLLAGAAQDVETTNEGPLLDFHASWPAAADAETALRDFLRRDAARRHAGARSEAQQAQDRARQEGYPFVRHGYRIGWEILGSTPQLLSLSAMTSAATGGGHSSDNYDGLLWDRLANRPAEIGPMVARAGLARRFCAVHATLGRATDSGPEACPRLGRRNVVPADTDGNGRFDTLRVYVAVNYFEAEGYPVDLPIEPSDIARIPAGLRPAFEVPGER